MTKLRLAYSSVECLCFLSALYFHYFSSFTQTTMAQLPGQNAWAEIQVLIADGPTSWKKVNAYRGGAQVFDPMWTYQPGGTPACNDPSHRTSLGRAYQHVHRSDFPIFDDVGAPITRAMIEAGWRNFFRGRYGKRNGQWDFAESGQAELLYNCHSFAMGTTSHWNELIDSKITDDYQLAYFHYDATSFVLEPGTNGGAAHSLKFWAFNHGPSGTGVLGTEEKYSESQIFFHAWPITDQNSPPASTSGDWVFRGVKYKPRQNLKVFP